MKILLVDDNDDIRRMLKRKFRKTDWDIIEGTNGEEGVNLAMKHQPDLILMDMHMPIMDGHEATQVLREKGYTGKIAALTASVMHKDTAEALKDGCDFFLSKPISKDFIDQLKTLLNS